MRINLNKMSEWIAAHEGLKKQVDIAQIKEVQRLALEYLAIVIWSEGTAGIEAVCAAINATSRRAGHAKAKTKTKTRHRKTKA